VPSIDATVGGVTSNSYATLLEAAAYHDARIPLPTPWVATGDVPTRALIMATRVLETLSVANRALRVDGQSRYYYTNRAWTGTPATTTQRLAWPRTGMRDRNGNDILSTVIPQDLKDATAELAGQLLMSDSTLDNAVSVGGIKSVSAGSVAVTFKDMIERHVLPDLVWELLPAWWFTNEIFEGSGLLALFDVVSE